MQVTSVNTTAASALSPQPAEDTARRADDFARVLQNAFYGAGSKAVARGAEQASQDSTPRTETRPVERSERPVTDRGVDRPVERTAERASERPAERSDTRDETAKSDTAPRDQAAKPVEKPVQKTDDAPAAQDAASQPAKDETAAETKPADAPKIEGEAEAKAEDGKTAAEAGEELADAKDEVKPTVADAPDAALILSLLQTQMPVAVVAAVPTVTPTIEGEAAPLVAAPVTAAAPVAAAPVTAAPQMPADAAAALAAAAAAVAGQVPAEAAAPQAGVDAAAQDAAVKAAAQALANAAAQAAVQQAPAGDATQTSVAALLSQQQTMSKEDFAAIQQVLAAQAQAQLQDDVKTVVTAPPQQIPLAQPQIAAAVVAPKSEGKTEKSSLTLDVQTVTAVAPKTLVDQSALMTMQGDEDLADAALLQQQMQAQAQQQPAGPEMKFAAALQTQLVADAPLPVNAAAVQHSPAHLAPQVGAVSTPAGQATQASHAAQQQTLARNLNAYIPAGEQVAVQIKKGAAEGIDKISIRLDPGNLGNVEIKMEVGHDGRLMAVIAADKPETLQMLQKDAASLEQSLRDAGLKTDQQSLSFSLRDQNQAQSGRDGRDGAGYGRQRGRGTEEYADTGRIDPAQAAAAQAQRVAAARGGLDIKI